MPALLNDILDPKLVVLELREQTAAEAILEIVERLRDGGLVRGLAGVVIGPRGAIAGRGGSGRLRTPRAGHARHHCRPAVVA